MTQMYSEDAKAYNIFTLNREFVWWYIPTAKPKQIVIMRFEACYERNSRANAPKRFINEINDVRSSGWGI